MRLRLLWILLILVMVSSCGSDDGNATDGDAIDGDVADGDSSDGDEPDGDVSDGDMTDGDTTDGDDPLSTAECLRDPECSRVMVAAHRGYAAIHPENSLASFRHAAEVGAAFVELDVWHTADDGLVIMHESDVSKFTDGEGDITDLTLEEIAGLTLTGCEEGNVESCTVPTFTDALALAGELGILLIVDLKTDRGDLVVDAIRASTAYNLAVLNGEWSQLFPMLEDEPDMLVMPRVESEDDFNAILADYPELLIADIEAVGPVPELTAAIVAVGVKAQQDAMAGGDLQAEMFGDFSGWKEFVDARVSIMQTQQPQLLVPAVEAYNQTGVFPESTE